MKKFICILFLIGIIGCSVEKTVVVMEKCPRCDKVFSAESTLAYGKYAKNSKDQLVFRSHKGKVGSYIVESKNDNVINQFNYRFCEDCGKVKMDSFFVIGKKEYRKGSYNAAVVYFKNAEELGSEEASLWMSKAEKKEAEAERRIK